MSKDSILEYECYDSRGRPQGNAIMNVLLSRNCPMEKDFIMSALLKGWADVIGESSYISTGGE